MITHGMVYINSINMKRLYMHLKQDNMNEEVVFFFYFLDILSTTQDYFVHISTK